MKRLLFIMMILTPLITPQPARALDFSSMFSSKPPLNEDERKETLQRIKEVQDKLRLLQDKLRVLEKRKAQESAATSGDAAAPQPVSVETNWQEIDQTTTKPGDYGLYTYLLFNGPEENRPALGSLEDLILTIETLPPTTEPAAIGNRFLLPVEPRQSMVVLARRPYDFKLSRVFLERLGLEELPEGPVLVSLAEPLDPYSAELAPPFVAVALGLQEPQRNLKLARVWHGYEKSPIPATGGHLLSDLFWQILDGAGPTRVTRSGGKLLVDLAPPLVQSNEPALLKKP